ncbi:MAG TPA: hypothetical protein VIR34_12495 [Gemmatimonadaceae bacterium]
MSLVTRALGPRLIAALLAFYAMGGILLAAAMISGRDPRFRWGALAAAAAVFAVVAGTAALATWRLERRAPAWAIACGICGAGLMAFIPVASRLPPGALHDAWRAAVLGGVLFLAFMLVAAAYLRAWMRAATDGTDL